MARTAVFFLFLSFIVVAAAMAYSPPIGIPNPKSTWGVLDPIDAPKPTATTYAPGWFESTPRQNSIASGDAHDCYYVDNTSGSATDTSNTYGYPGHPRLTVPNIAYSPGSYIEIHGDGATGSHVYSTGFNPRGTGTDTAPIWFVGVNSPLFTAKLYIGASNYSHYSYMIFDGIHLKGARVDMIPSFTGNTIDHIALRNCELDGNSQSIGDGIILGMQSLTDPTLTLQDVVIYNCNIHNYGDKNNPDEECGVYPTDWVTRLWVLDSNIHDNAEHGCGGSHVGRHSSNYYYIGRNQIHDNLTYGVDIKGYGTGVVISENNFYGTKDVWVPQTSGALINGATYAWKDVSGSPDFSNVGAGAPPYTVGSLFGATSSSTPTSWGTATVDGHRSSGIGIVANFHYAGDSAGPTSWNLFPGDVSFIFNTVKDGRSGVYTSRCGRLRVIGNVFYNQHTAPTDYSDQSYAIHISGVKDDQWIANNTFYDFDGGIDVEDSPIAYSSSTTYYRADEVSYSRATYICINDNSDAGISNIAPSDADHWKSVRLQIWGNVLVNRAKPAQAEVQFASSDFANNSVDVDRNDVYDSTYTGTYIYGGSTLHDLAWMKANTSKESHSINTDPLLTNPTTDFTLSSGSPAINSSTEGTGTTAYADFQSVYGIGIKYDRAGAVRPLDGAWDMGAYEFGGGGVPPSAPVGLRLGP